MNFNCILKIWFNLFEVNVYNYFKFLIYIFVYIGEISSGKFIIVNVIIGEKILFIGIEVIIIRVCRVKYFKELKILICSGIDKEYKYMILFISLEEIVDKLKCIV